MIPVKGASFGRFGGWRRRYPGGSECRSIFLTVSRAMPNRLGRLSLAQTINMAGQPNAQI